MSTPLTPTTPQNNDGPRWMVRLERVRPSMFGEGSRGGLMWSVTQYRGRHASGRLLHPGGRTFFAARTEALKFAHAQAARWYAAWHHARVERALR